MPTVSLDHTIVLARDNRASAEFLAGLLGLEVGAPWGPFVPLRLSNGVTLDYVSVDHDIPLQHLAFLVPEEDFDAILDRIRAAGLEHFADPHMTRPGINHNHSGRGVYFLDPAGHGMEVLTAPYDTSA
ncbi:VOC family protein [Pseudonocardia yuanmonensis]|uniref:VOC family protein n=1 Tax=Pseudonocardia yuanmonensis TaxID=1095914 RepID=A0ABP8W7D4_9PSEU